MEVYDLTAHELADLLRRGEMTSVEVTGAIFKRIHDVDPDVQAYVTLTEDLAYEAARKLDGERGQGHSLPYLAGVPAGLKDVLCTRGIRTTCSSRILEHFVPPYNATVVSKLAAAGAVFTGKLNMDEFAMGSSTENSAFFPTRNPWNLGCVPGGSSGGPAAAVAAGEAPYALGTDTGGSIRQPASLCGIVGLKPTYGLVSRYGLVAFASSLDQVGPMTKDVRDCALVLNLIAGHDPLDSTSAPMPVPDYTSFLTGEIRGLEDRHPPGVLRRWAGCRGERGGEGVSGQVGGVGRHHRGVFLPACRICPALLLPDRPRRSQFQPGPVRRRPLRLPGNAG